MYSYHVLIKTTVAYRIPFHFLRIATLSIKKKQKKNGVQNECVLHT